MDQAPEDSQYSPYPSHDDQEGYTTHSGSNVQHIQIANAAASASTKTKHTITLERLDGINRLAIQAEQTTRRGNGYDSGSRITDVNDRLEVLCGPLLNYKGMSNAASTSALWHGSVLIVSKPGQHPKDLTFRYRGPYSKKAPIEIVSGKSNNVPLSKISDPNFPLESSAAGLKLYEDPAKAFWRFNLNLPLRDHEACWEYSIANTRLPSAGNAWKSSSRTFVVPSYLQSMRIMFHSCNGFSIGTDEDVWSGPALWNDVLRLHQQKPFHVMIGGGDQIYNDGVRVTGPLKTWTDIGNPKKRRDYHFDEVLRAACDSFYSDHYIEWYSSEPFARANSQIAQINIWDDHGSTNLATAFNGTANQ